jgi:hypothetical protein
MRIADARKEMRNADCRVRNEDAGRPNAELARSALIPHAYFQPSTSQPSAFRISHFKVDFDLCAIMVRHL